MQRVNDDIMRETGDIAVTLLICMHILSKGIDDPDIVYLSTSGAVAYSMLANGRPTALPCGISAATLASTRRAAKTIPAFKRSFSPRFSVPRTFCQRRLPGTHSQAAPVDMAGDLKLKFAIDRGGTFTDIFCEVSFLTMLMVLRAVIALRKQRTIVAGTW